MYRKMLALFLAAVMTALWAVPAAAAEGMTLTADCCETEVDGKIRLSWTAPGADYVKVRMVKAGKGEMAEPDARKRPVSKKDFAVTMREEGVFTIVAEAYRGDRVFSSRSVRVTVSSGLERVLSQGMDNIWKIRVIICRSVRLPGYQRSFTQAQVNHIRNLLSLLPGTLFNLSDGRMCAVVTDVTELTEPVTSVSGDCGDLVPEKDFPLSQTLTDDTTLLAVYAPLENHPKTDWLGLGGYTHTYRGQTFYMAEFSSAFAAPESGRWERNGIRYDLGTCALVHEILHAVELNSRNNGWGGFEMLHDAGPNGYDDQKAFMDWYGDLMTDRLKNGKAGFRAVSFYVKHDPGMRARAGNP